MEYNKIYRRRYDKAIAGVCSGISDYYKMDPFILQTIFFFLMWSPIPIIPIYIVLWIIMKPEQEPK